MFRHTYVPQRLVDAIVSNPPYRKKGSGRQNPDPVKAVARHEIRMTLADLVTAAGWLLVEGGSAHHFDDRRKERWNI